MAFPSGKEQPMSHKIPPPECKAPQEHQKVDRSRNAAPSKQRRGYDCEFVQKPQELQNDCPICLFVLREPFQVTCCGYSFCHACIEHTLSNKKTCPACNEAGFSAFPNKGLQRSLYSFRVRCTHQKSGCEWTGELRELDGHLNLNQEMNKRLIGCEFAAIACTHCYEYFSVGVCMFTRASPAPSVLSAVNTARTIALCIKTWSTTTGKCASATQCPAQINVE